jgi:hypothetical protein
LIFSNRFFSGLKPGSLIGTVRANDIDSFPPISYKIAESSSDVTEVAVDTFTGQIYLLQKPTGWKSNPLLVTISATDQVIVKTLFVIIIIQFYYFFSVFPLKTL